MKISYNNNQLYSRLYVQQNILSYKYIYYNLKNKDKNNTKFYDATVIAIRDEKDLKKFFLNKSF